MAAPHAVNLVPKIVVVRVRFRSRFLRVPTLPPEAIGHDQLKPLGDVRYPVVGQRGAAGSGAVPQDYAESVEWYRRAGQRGDAHSQVQVGIAYREGQGVPQDYAQAHMWFNLAAANGNTLAVSFRDSLSRRMTRAQIAEAQKLAREWMAKHQK